MRKLSQGEQVKIAADDYNRWQEAGRAHAMSRLNQSQQIVTPDSQEGIVLVKNTLSRAMPRFSVLGLRGSTYNPLYSDQQLTEFKNQIALHGETPSSITSGRFCVLQNDAQPGEVVAGMVSGVTPCRIKVESLTDEFAEIETTTTVDQTRYLKSGSSGSAQILFRPEYLGEQWGVVRLGNRVSDTWKIASAQFDGTGAYNPASSGSEKVLYFSSISAEDGAPFELTSGLNKELRVTADVNPCFVVGRLDVTVDYVRNSWSQINGGLKREFDDSGSWASIGLGSEIYRISWPDVATISGGTAYSKSLYIHSGVQLSDGMDLRGSLEVAYGSTSPQVSAGGEIHIYYK